GPGFAALDPRAADARQRMGEAARRPLRRYLYPDGSTPVPPGDPCRLSLRACFLLAFFLVADRTAKLLLHRALHLSRLDAPLEGRQVPVVAKWIIESAHAVTPEHVGRRHDLLHAVGLGLLVGRIHVFDVDVEARIRAL